MSIDDDFARMLETKRSGGVPLTVGVSSSVWMGGMVGDVAHEPLVSIGPASWESEEELTFFRDHASVEALVAELRAAARRAWGEPASP